MGPTVCLFTDSLSPSGVGQHMLTLAEQLRDRFSLSLVCPPTPAGLTLLDRARGLGLEVLGLEVRGRPDASRDLGRWLQAHRVQVLHCHAGVSWEGHDGIRAARWCGLPAVVRTEHLPDLTVVFRTEELPDLVYSPYHREDRRLDVERLRELVAADRAAYLRVIELVDRLICVSAAVRDTFAEVGVPAGKLRVVRNGIGPRSPSLEGARTRAALGIDAGSPVVLTIGRLIDVKNHDFLLAAVPAVLQRQPTATFLWVGGGPLEKELRARISALGVDGSVRLLGQRDDVPDLMAAADLLVLPSLVEGLPLVVLEAMAAGLPVVATRVAGTSEVVRDGVTGRLVEPGGLTETRNVAELAAAILEPLEDPKLAKRWGAEGTSLVETEFSAGRMAEQTAQVYAEVLS